MTAINNTGGAAQSASGSMANVRFGVYTQPAPVAGKTVGEVREHRQIFEVLLQQSSCSSLQPLSLACLPLAWCS